MKLAIAIALLQAEAATSHDPDTQTACLAVNEGGGFLGASNRLPDGVNPTKERTERPAKYGWIMRAEDRLIAKAAAIGFTLRGSTLYLNWFPCSGCAGKIIQAGIKTLICDREKYEARKDDPRYDFAQAMEKLAEGGVTVEWLYP